MVTSGVIEVDADPIGRRLAAFGEEFMTMFDDQPSARNALKQRRASVEDDVRHASSAAYGTHSEREASPTECSPSTPEQRQQDMDELGFPGSRRPSSRAGPASSGRAGSQSLGSSSMVKLKRLFLDERTPEQIRDAEARAQQQAEKKLRRQDAVLHHDFDKMRREVESLGASMLGKKQKREFDRGVLHQVKAKPMKGPRIPANLGFKLAKAKKQRQQAAKQEAIASGMHLPKAIGKAGKGGKGHKKGRKPEKLRQ